MFAALAAFLLLSAQSSSEGRMLFVIGIAKRAKDATRAFVFSVKNFKAGVRVLITPTFNTFTKSSKDFVN